MEDLLKHHIGETRDRFAEIRDDLKAVNEKLDALTTFKAEISTQARVISFVWGLVWGGITLVVTLVLKKYVD